MNYDSLKRLQDLLFGLTLFVLCSPLMWFVILFIICFMPGPVFFRQLRSGKDGVPFKIYKFRTMTLNMCYQKKALADADRITLLGSFLRNTSIDELPELINVINGDMSLVGPRPLPVSYLKRYNNEQLRRHEVKPGLTGWAQINGRNELTWEEKFTLDLWYVNNRSLSLDFKIMLLTIVRVITQTGISHKNCATMEEFRG